MRKIFFANKKNRIESFLVRWTANILGLLAAVYLVPGISFPKEKWWILVLAALVFSIINILIKPVILILSIPTIIITFGLFYFIINGLMLYLVTILVPLFEISGFLAAFWGAIIVSLVNLLIHIFTTSSNVRIEKI